MKNPFSEQDHSSVALMAVGMMLLVFVGLIVSLVLDKSTHLMSPKDTTMIDANARLTSQVTKLETKLEIRERQKLAAIHNREQAERVKELEKQLISAAKEIDVLHQLIAGEKASIKLISKAREDHRLEYREYVRGEAIGKRYEQITTRLGENYHDVQVTNVTSLGISITHQTGTKMLGFRQIPAEWQRKLMFTAAEMAAAAKEDQRRQAVTINKIDRQVSKNTKIQKNLSRIRAESTIRRQMASYKIKLSTARLEASLARNKLSAQKSLRNNRIYSNSITSYRYYNTSTGRYYTTGYRPRYRSSWVGSKSVPGSLETWEQRAVKYERAVTHYASKILMLQTRLEAMQRADTR